MSEVDLEDLDARAEAVARANAFSEGSSSNSSSSSDNGNGGGNGGSDELEDDEKWAREAAVTDADVRALARERAARFERGEDAAAHLDADWADLEDERRYLEDDHRAKFASLLHRFEHELPDDGDVVDLMTERVVVDGGHLNAMRRRGAPLFTVDSESSASDDSAGDDGTGDGTGSASDGSDFAALNPLVTACEEPAELLNHLVEQTCGRIL